MKEILAITTLASAVYVAPLGDSLSWQAELIIRSALSMALVLTSLSLTKKPCFIIIAGCEIIALVYNTVLAMAYSMSYPEADLAYSQIMDSLFTVEILALSLGMIDELRRLQLNSKRGRFGSGTNPLNLRSSGGL